MLFSRTTGKTTAAPISAIAMAFKDVAKIFTRSLKIRAFSFRRFGSGLTYRATSPPRFPVAPCTVPPVSNRTANP